MHTNSFFGMRVLGMVVGTKQGPKPFYFIFVDNHTGCWLAAEGVHKLPAINSSNDLKTALQKLGSIPSRKILVFLACLLSLLFCHQFKL